MGLKLRWFRARLNLGSSPAPRDFSAPAHGLYRPTYSVYEADAARPLPSRQVSRSVPHLADPRAPREVAVAVNPAFARHNASSLNDLRARDVTPPEAAGRTKNRLQLKLNIPEPGEKHTPAGATTAAVPSETAKSRTKNKMAPAAPPGKRPVSDKNNNSSSNKKGEKEVVDLKFGGESES
ncbi:uncharacterized protein LOC134539559 [Bacillus rossius redtenbacheri]|uniref:uncharacterized protein LOC134539559 n=1 Tax=Bacillus rossius redtenbacheri TaxID=93214 RepID=UPI002FDDF1E7